MLSLNGTAAPRRVAGPPSSAASVVDVRPRVASARRCASVGRERGSRTATGAALFVSSSSSVVSNSSQERRHHHRHHHDHHQCPASFLLPRPLAAAMSESKRRRVGASTNSSGGAAAGTADGAGAAASPAVVASPPVKHSVGATFRAPGLVVTDHRIRVPLDYTGKVAADKGKEITVFVREVTSPANARRASSLPALLYLQGGPGFESPRPGEASGWIKAATSSSFRVLLMDQRGTGLSSPITPRSLAALPGGPERQAEYLSHFRADSIVRDAERVRAALVPPRSSSSSSSSSSAAAAAAAAAAADGGGGGGEGRAGATPPAPGRWTLLGQSFGGFCALTYLSLHPQGVAEALITGGVPPALHERCPADRAYEALYRRVLQQNRRYYQRFPSDLSRVRRIVKFLAAQPGGGALLPSGTRLTPRAFQLLGLSGLGSSGGFERLHYMLETFFDGESAQDDVGSGDGGGGGGGDGDGAAASDDPPADAAVSPAFARAFESWMPWESNPLYALLHEAIYVSGPGAASAWSAQRVRDSNPEFKEAFDAVSRADKGEQVNFTGEMVYPWIFEDFAALRPLKGAADLLAAKSDWPPLYDPRVLSRPSAPPVAAALYLEDMYVDHPLAEESAEHVKGIRVWSTNEYKHSGIRDDGARIFDRLLSMARDVLPVE